VDEWRIRPAERHDADPIARLFLASKATLTFLPDTHTVEETFYFIASIVLRDQEVHVAETNGEISGFIAMHGDMVEHLYVRPDLLRRGIGGARCFGEPWSASRRGSGCGSSWRNVPARRFYERHGLRLVEQTDGSRNEERTSDALSEWRRPDP
jgi:GNAT superfamily N-acetyltransferase